MRWFTPFVDMTTHALGSVYAIIASVLLIILWLMVGPLFHWSDSWSLFINTITTIVTFIMVFIIQASQNRDGVAIQAKLDELIRATDAARNTFVALDRKPESEIEEIRRRD